MAATATACTLMKRSFRRSTHFASLAAYGDDDFFIDNPLNRHACSSHDPLLRNADGLLDLLVQADPPPSEQQANWLSVQASAPFQLTLRLYRPAQR